MYEIDPSSNLCLAITQELFLYCDYYALQPRQEKDSNIIRIIIIIPAIARYYGNSFLFLFSSLRCIVVICIEGDQLTIFSQRVFT